MCNVSQEVTDMSWNVQYNSDSTQILMTMNQNVLKVSLMWSKIVDLLSKLRRIQQLMIMDRNVAKTANGRPYIATKMF